MKPDALQLVPVCSEHFARKIFQKGGDCEVQKFCKKNYLNTTAFNIFLNLEHLPQWMRDQLPQAHDVILMDKVNNT